MYLLSRPNCHLSQRSLVSPTITGTLRVPEADVLYLENTVHTYLPRYMTSTVFNYISYRTIVHILSSLNKGETFSQLHLAASYMSASRACLAHEALGLPNTLQARKRLEQRELEVM